MGELTLFIIYYVVCIIVIFLYYKKRKEPFDGFGYPNDATFGERFTLALLICIPLLIEFFIL